MPSARPSNECCGPRTDDASARQDVAVAPGRQHQRKAVGAESPNPDVETVQIRCGERIAIDGMAEQCDSDGPPGPMARARRAGRRSRPMHRDIAIAMSNLAGYHALTLAYPEAVALYLRALAIQELVAGAQDPATIATVRNLAGVYADQKR